MFPQPVRQIASFVETGSEQLNKLEQLKQELHETKILLESARLSESTRYVLERLREDLERRIAAMEWPKAGQLESPEVPEA